MQSIDVSKLLQIIGQKEVANLLLQDQVNSLRTELVSMKKQAPQAKEPGEGEAQ